MKRTALAGFVACLVLFVSGAGASMPSDPHVAAKALVARLTRQMKREHIYTYGASPVVHGHGRRWMAFGYTTSAVGYLGGGPGASVIEIFRWTGSRWRLDGRVAGNDLGPAQWLSGASLTGGDDPDFAVAGCGAGDTNCLSIVSHTGGRWHSDPFEYGYGLSHEVNGVPSKGGVETEVDACSCAGGPSTWTFERFRAGAFRPASPPGKVRPCNLGDFQRIADPHEVQNLAFDHAACEAGWGIAVGTGSGFSGKAVGLFIRNGPAATWELLTLNDGNALPAAPAIYDLPVGLLARLGGRFGASLAAEVAAARLIASLERAHFGWWPQQEGIVDAGGARWLIAVGAHGKTSRPYNAPPSLARIYRWSGTAWLVDGVIADVPRGMNLSYYGGWFVDVPARGAGSVAFAVRGSELAHPPTGVLTNAGGYWHVARG